MKIVSLFLAYLVFTDEKDDSESPAPVWEEADRDTALEVEDLLMEAYCTRIEPSWKPVNTKIKIKRRYLAGFNPLRLFQDPVEPVSSTQTRRVADGATAKSRPQGRQRTDIILPRLNCRSCDFRCRSSLVMFRHKMTEHRDFM